MDTEHAILVHSDGSACMDGCDKPAIPIMLAKYDAHSDHTNPMAHPACPFCKAVRQGR